jgi:MmyB-like transcription regulator ligand binding domain
LRSRTTSFDIGPATDDPATTTLISDVCAKSHAFAVLWDSHGIDVHEHKEKKIHDEDLGEIRLDLELLTAFDTPNWLPRSPANSPRTVAGSSEAMFQPAPPEEVAQRRTLHAAPTGLHRALQ